MSKKVVCCITTVREYFLVEEGESPGDVFAEFTTNVDVKGADIHQDYEVVDPKRMDPEQMVYGADGSWTAAELAEG